MYAKNTHKYLIGITIEFKSSNQLYKVFISPMPKAGTIIIIPTKTAVILYPLIGAPFLFVYIRIAGIYFLSPSENSIFKGASIETANVETWASIFAIAYKIKNRFPTP